MSVEVASTNNTASPPGFFGALLDFSFKSSITVKLIKLLYGLLLAQAVLVALFLLGGAMATLGSGAGLIVGVVGGGVAVALLAIGARVYCELLMVLFRIADNTGELVRLTRERS